MDDLSELHDSLRNLVARPGTFDDLFAETVDDDLTSVLMDGFAEAQLEGLFAGVDVDDDGMLDTDLTRAQGALIVLLAGVRFLRSQLVNAVSHRRYEAGGATFEEDMPVALLRDILKDLSAQKDRLVAAVEDEGASDGTARAFAMADQYLMRVTHHLPYGAPTLGGW